MDATLEMAAGAKPDPPQEFAGIEDVESVIADFEALLDDRKAIRTALGLAQNPNDQTSERCKVAVEKAGKWLDLANKRPKLALQKFEELGYAIDDGDARYRRACEERILHRQLETDELALELQPRQQKAVRAIAKALEALSVALREEAEIRAEFLQSASMSASAYLPDVTAEIAFIGTLRDPRSPASAWARRMRNLEILK